MSAMDSSITDHLAQANSLDMLALVGEVRGQAGLHPHPHPPARGELPYVILRVGRRVPHLENGLLTIFRLVCGSSAPAPSCWHERRQQTSWAAATPRPLALKPQHSPSPITILSHHPTGKPTLAAVSLVAAAAAGVEILPPVNHQTPSRATVPPVNHQTPSRATVPPVNHQTPRGWTKGAG